MFRNPKHLGRWLAIAVAIGLMFSAAALVAKPTKPPGGQDPPGSNGGGVIYFTWNMQLYTMNDDGSDVTLVAGFPYDVYAPWLCDPSRQLHAGKRWFVRQHDVPGQSYPDGVVRRVLVALSDAGDVVPLTIPADLEPLEWPHWGVTAISWGGTEDGYLSWAGRCWDIDPASPTYGDVLEGGLYVTEVAFDDDGNVAEAGASVLLVPFPLVPSNAYRPYDVFVPGPDMYTHDWAPDGTQFVFTAVSTDEVRIGDVATAQSHVLFAEPGADGMGSARWSPAGDTIMFKYDPDIGHGRLMLITPDGSHSKMLVRGSPEWSVAMGVWSPTGSHLVYQYWDHWEADSHIVRATANGDNKTRITDKSMGRGMESPEAIGWRAAE